MKQKAESRKENQKLNVGHRGSKASHSSSKVSNSKQGGKGASTVTRGSKSNRRHKAAEGERTTGLKHTETQKQTGMTLRRGKALNGRPQPEKTSVITKDVQDTNKPLQTNTTKPVRDKQRPTKTRYQSSDDVTDSEEESQEVAGSSVDATGEETDTDEKEEEQDANEERTEMQRRERTSEEETEVSDTERDTEPTADTDKELSEQATSTRDSDAGLVTSSEEEDKEREAEVANPVLSESDEKEDTDQKPTAKRVSKQQKPTQRQTKTKEEPKYKMFRKTKADKQAEKAEKQRIKAEKVRLQKEAKQKAKDEKRKKKKEQKDKKKNKSATVTQTPRGLSPEIKKDSSVEAEEEEEEEEAEHTLTKAIKSQKKILHLKTKGKDLMSILGAEPQREVEEESGEGQPQSLPLGKVKMESLRHKANQTKLDDVGLRQPKDRLLAQRTGMMTLRRMSGWIQKKMPRGMRLRKKVSSCTTAIGVSRWLYLLTIKPKEATEKSKKNLFKHRMAMRVAGKTTLTSRKVKFCKDTTAEENLQAHAGEVVEEAGEKEVEAKYAVVLPRMNKQDKAMTAKMSQDPSGPSTTPGTTGSAEEPTISEPKPPKPGARLVLPVKPDLNLLKSLKKPVQGPDGAGTGRNPGSVVGTTALEGTSTTEDVLRKGTLDHLDGVSVLQASRGKLGPLQINLSKMSLSGGNGSTQTRAKVPQPERDVTAGTPQSTAQLASNGGMARSLYEEEADREVAQLMGGGLHWAGNPRMSAAPQVFVVLQFSVSLWRTYRNNGVFQLQWRVVTSSCKTNHLCSKFNTQCAAFSSLLANHHTAAHGKLCQNSVHNSPRFHFLVKSDLFEFQFYSRLEKEVVLSSQYNSLY